MMSATLRTLIALVSAAVVAAPAAGAPKPVAKLAVGKAAACDLGARIVAEKVKAGYHVFDGGADYFRGEAERTFKDSPYASLRRTIAPLVRKPPRNLFVTCPELASHLPPGGRMATAADQAEVSGIRRITGVYVATLSTPVIAADGRSAMVFEFQKCAGLCGIGGLFVYQRDGKGWSMKPTELYTVMS